MYKFEVGKTYKTRDGHEAVIYAFYPNQEWCYHGAIKFEDDWLVTNWTKEGAILDLMPPEGYFYINIYESSSGTLYPANKTHTCKRDADQVSINTTYNRVGCIKVKLEERFDD